MQLIIGNKTYSSWSLRPWLLMRHFQIPFKEILIKLDMEDTTTNIRKYSAASRVPVLQDGDLVLWESLAIMEYLNERFPEKRMYPADPKLRALARAYANEMHAGFGPLRQHLSFHAKRRLTNFDSSVAKGDIERIQSIFGECLKRSGGPFLFGEFSLVDAMYAPVVGRFQTYGVPVNDMSRGYCERVLGLPAMRDWYAGAEAEDFVAKDHEK